MLRNVFTKTLWDDRWSLLWWAVGVTAMVFLYVSPYQTYLGDGALDLQMDGVAMDTRLFETLGIEIALPAGYLGATVFGPIGALPLIIAMTVAGARMIAGDEEVGLVGLLLAGPVSRTSFVGQRFAALTVRTTALGGVLLVSSIAAVAIDGPEMGVGRLAVATVGLTLLALAFGTLALAVGAATGRHGLAIGLTGLVAATTYLANTLASQADSLEPLRWLTPFYHYEHQNLLRSGLDPAWLTLQVCVPLGLLVFSIWTFNRRDVSM